MSGQSAASAFSRPGAPSTTTSSGLGNPRRTRSSSSARQAASLSPPMDLIASSTFWPSARTPSATSSETEVAFRSSRTRATVPSRINRTIGSSASPADHVLADRPSERRGKRPPHPAGVGSRKIGPGDQGVGGPGAALIGAQRTAPPFAPADFRLQHRRQLTAVAGSQRLESFETIAPKRIVIPDALAAEQAPNPIGMLNAFL